jgi:hypothetical protein
MRDFAQRILNRPNGKSLPLRIFLNTVLKSGEQSMKPAGRPFTSARKANWGTSNGFSERAIWRNSSRVIGTNPQLLSHALL